MFRRSLVAHGKKFAQFRRALAAMQPVRYHHPVRSYQKEGAATSTAKEAASGADDSVGSQVGRTVSSAFRVMPVVSEFLVAATGLISAASNFLYAVGFVIALYYAYQLYLQLTSVSLWFNGSTSYVSGKLEEKRERVRTAFSDAQSWMLCKKQQWMPSRNSSLSETPEEAAGAASSSRPTLWERASSFRERYSMKRVASSSPSPADTEEQSADATATEGRRWPSVGVAGEAASAARERARDALSSLRQVVSTRSSSSSSS